MESTSSRAAIVVPGMGYGAQAPLLMFAAEAAEARGARAEAITWSLGNDALLLAPASKLERSEFPS